MISGSRLGNAAPIGRRLLAICPPSGRARAMKAHSGMVAIMRVAWPWNSGKFGPSRLGSVATACRTVISCCTSRSRLWPSAAAREVSNSSISRWISFSSERTHRPAKRMMGTSAARTVAAVTYTLRSRELSARSLRSAKTCSSGAAGSPLMAVPISFLLPRPGSSPPRRGELLCDVCTFPWHSGRHRFSSSGGPGGSARPCAIPVNRRRGTAVPPVARGQEAAASPGSIEACRSIQAGTGRFLERRKAGSKSFDW